MDFAIATFAILNLLTHLPNTLKKVLEKHRTMLSCKKKISESRKSGQEVSMVCFKNPQADFEEDTCSSKESHIDRISQSYFLGCKVK